MGGGGLDWGALYSTVSFAQPAWYMDPLLFQCWANVRTPSFDAYDEFNTILWKWTMSITV